MNRRERSTRRGILLLVFVALASSCALFPVVDHPGTAEWDLPSLVTLGDPEASMAVNQDLISWVGYGKGDGKLSVLARDGDLVMLERTGAVEIPFAYSKRDGPHPEVRADDFRVWIGENLVTLILSSEAFDPEWVLEAEEEELAGIRLCLMDDSPFPESPAFDRAMKRLARIRPDAGWVVKHPGDLDRVLSLFTPKRIWIIDEDPVSEETWERVRQLKELRVLTINAESLEGMGELRPPEMLRHLTLCEWNPDRLRLSEKGWDSLSSLTLSASPAAALTGLDPLRGIRELHLRHCKELNDISGIEKLTGLKAVTISGSPDLRDIGPLVKTTDLAWLGLPEPTTQAQFEAVIGQNRGLRYLELIRCRHVKDLLPIRGLKDIEVLVLLSKEKGARPGIPRLERLRLLALSEDAYEDSDYIGRIGKEHPDCEVIKAAPYCMGSGWILLLWLVVPFWLLLTHAVRKRGIHAG